MKYIVEAQGKTYSNKNRQNKKYIQTFSPPLSFVYIISLPRVGVLGEVFLANHLLAPKIFTISVCATATNTETVNRRRVLVGSSILSLTIKVSRMHGGEESPSLSSAL